ncbi:MAG: hypothetical protein LBG81_06925 [Coriobacteriaceae bacterium]|jgi:hypothetical protein|nr:hypothetical protein [Coriobacteriaceae bacterium]
MIGTRYGKVGEPFTLEGYAQDFASPLAALQVSGDQGRTWTTYPLHDIDADRNVNWSFSFTPEQAGTHTLLMRAQNEKGELTPEAARVVIRVSG